MRRVFVYRANLLPYSETFIRAQVLSYSTWHPVLVGEQLVPGISLDGMDVCLPSKAKSAAQTFFWKALRKAGIVPSGMLRPLLCEAPAVFHAHFGTDAVGIWPLARRLRMPFAVTLHGYDINTFREQWEQGPRKMRSYPERLLAMARQPGVHFVAVSEAIKRRALEFGIAEERISVQYIGIDPGCFLNAGRAITERRRRILFTGRMVEKKGAEYLIRAFARVKAVVRDAELVMIGDGPLLAPLQALAMQLNVPVEFAGSLPSAEVKKHLDEARVSCVPSIVAQNGDAEGLAIVILEAQACGVPVVTSARGGISEGILDGVTGFTFAEKDVAVLADRLTQILTDDALATSMSHAAPAFVARKFDIRRCTAALETLYERLVDERAVLLPAHRADFS